MGYKFNPFTGGLDSVNREGYIEGDLDVTGDLTVTGSLSAAQYLGFNVAGYYGQVVRMNTSDTISIALGSTYQSTGLTATLDKRDSNYRGRC
jgi:hypothetical protein